LGNARRVSGSQLMRTGVFSRSGKGCRLGLGKVMSTGLPCSRGGNRCPLGMGGEVGDRMILVALVLC
jgi:hypothetical protein